MKDIDGLLFYRNEQSGRIYCNGRKYFVYRKECNSYDRYGQHFGHQMAHTRNCGCPKFLMLPYHDGSNNRTAILDDINYSKLTRKESALYKRVLKAMVWTQETTGMQHFTSTVDGKTYHIQESCWQGSFERYAISESEE